MSYTAAPNNNNMHRQNRSSTRHPHHPQQRPQHMQQMTAAMSIPIQYPQQIYMAAPNQYAVHPNMPTATYVNPYPGQQPYAVFQQSSAAAAAIGQQSGGAPPSGMYYPQPIQQTNQMPAQPQAQQNVQGRPPSAPSISSTPPTPHQMNQAGVQGGPPYPTSSTSQHSQPTQMQVNSQQPYNPMHQQMGQQHQQTPRLTQPHMSTLHTVPLPQQQQPAQPLPKRVRKPLAIINPDTHTVINKEDVAASDSAAASTPPPPATTNTTSTTESSHTTNLPTAQTKVEEVKAAPPIDDKDKDDIRNKFKEMVTSKLSGPTNASPPIMNGVATSEPTPEVTVQVVSDQDNVSSSQSTDDKPSSSPISAPVKLTTDVDVTVKSAEQAPATVDTETNMSPAQQAPASSAASTSPPTVTAAQSAPVKEDTSSPPVVQSSSKTVSDTMQSEVKVDSVDSAHSADSVVEVTPAAVEPAAAAADIPESVSTTSSESPARPIEPTGEDVPATEVLTSSVKVEPITPVQVNKQEAPVKEDVPAPAPTITAQVNGSVHSSAPTDAELMPPPAVPSEDKPSTPPTAPVPSTSAQSGSGSTTPVEQERVTAPSSPLRPAAIRSKVPLAGGMKGSKSVAADMSKLTEVKPYKVDSADGGKKVYDRDFLMSLQKALLSQQKPEGLPNFTDIINSHPHTSREMRPPGRRDLNPAYFKGAASPRNSASRGGKGASMSRDSKGAAGKAVIEYKRAKAELSRSENAWKPVSKAGTTASAAADEKTPEQKEEALLRVFRGYLNKITPQTFQKIVAQILAMEVETHSELDGIMKLVFEKSIAEPTFSVTYANLCHKLSKDLKVGETGFRKLLLVRCQKEFESSAADDEDMVTKQKALEEATGEQRTKLKEEYDLFATKARRRKLGNIRFIGELYKLQMLTGKIMHDCIVSLLKSTDEEGYECLCKLLRTIGKFLDNPKAQNLMSQYFNKMKELSENTKKVSSRVRFALKDIIELRANNWKPRQQQQDNNPKTIAEVHAEAALEAHETKAMIEKSNIPSRGSQSRNPPPRNQRRGDDDSGAGPSGWNVVPSMKTHQRIDPQKLRLTQQAGSDTVTLGPPRGFGGGSGWGRGSSGSGKNTPPQQQEERASTPTNRFSALRDGGGGGEMERSSSGHRLPTGRGSMGRGINRSGASNRMGGTPRGSMEKERSSALATARQFSRTSGSRGPSRENSVEGRCNMRTPTPTRPDSRRTSDSSSKVVVAPVAVKQLSRDEWETKMKSIIDEYLHNKDLKEMMDYIRDLDAQSNKNLITECSINYTLERTGSARKTVGQMLAELIKHELLPLDLHLKGIDTVLEIADDLAIDIPNVWEYLAQLIAPMFTVASIPLVKLDTVCASLRSIGKAATLAAEILHEASSLTGHVEVGKRWVESSLQWTDFLPEGENLEEFISSKKLEYTLHTNVTKSSTSTSQSNVDIAATLEKFLQAGATNDVIFDWADSTLSEDRRSDQSFIKCLTTSVSRACIDGGSSFNEDKLKSRTPLLAKYLDSKPEREESALIALEELMNKLEHPANLLSDFCYALTDEDLIADESFFLWEKKSKSGIAVKSVGKFFDWLRNSQQVD